MANPLEQAPDLSGQNAIIFGGSGNVGEGIVRAWLETGATVFVPSRTQERADELLGRFPQAGETLKTVVGQVDSFDGSDAIVQSIVDQAGPISHSVSSIGGWWSGQPATELDETVWNEYFVSSTTAHFASARSSLRSMKQGGSHTMILGLSAYGSVAGASPILAHGGALRMMRVALSSDMGPTRRVNSVVLGGIISRSRPYGQSFYLRAEQAGRLTSGIAANPLVSGNDFMVTGGLSEYQNLLRNDFTVS